ncbi:DGQHR domain-containing protein [Vibrio brasiliensis]|uniref:DGQHR domain-containing protein DpdB n=1 Tax=Vibrio brasiliensis TaxID=170652 RepID=UPI001EFC67EC|nr:DGQHR domain-containing protein DpdB [Vibrio brasiliensis]MCG9751340.1 DGQHR domain-containing protein [Vibrio brasiliensis]
MMKKIALKVEQGSEVGLFMTTMNLAEIESICTISRVFRAEDNSLQGYQRAEIRRHIDNIAAYIDSDNAVIPNSIIMCVKSSTKVRINSNGSHELQIPREPNSAVLVDGQQRVAALKQSERANFYYPVCLLLSDDDAFERQQFLLINSAKPLPRSLIYELLPHANGVFNDELTRKRLPSLITQLMNFEPGSSLKGMIKLTTNPEGLIADNSMMKMIDNSLREGALYDLCELTDGIYSATHCDEAVKLLSIYFNAVREVFYDDWGKKPKDSRLFHGVGIAALGQLFDEIYYSFQANNRNDVFFEFCVKQLFQMKPYCSWSDGYWDFGIGPDGEKIVRKWNQLQNLSQDISMVTQHLITIYDKLKRGVPVVKGQ